MPLITFKDLKSHLSLSTSTGSEKIELCSPPIQKSGIILLFKFIIKFIFVSKKLFASRRHVTQKRKKLASRCHQAVKRSVSQHFGLARPHVLSRGRTPRLTSTCANSREPFHQPALENRPSRLSSHLFIAATIFWLKVSNCVVASAAQGTPICARYPPIAYNFSVYYQNPPNQNPSAFKI